MIALNFISIIFNFSFSHKNFFKSSFHGHTWTDCCSICPDFFRLSSYTCFYESKSVSSSFQAFLFYEAVLSFCIWAALIYVLSTWSVDSVSEPQIDISDMYIHLILEDFRTHIIAQSSLLSNAFSKHIDWHF